MAEEDNATVGQQKESLVARLDSEGAALLDSIARKLAQHGSSACPIEVCGDMTPSAPGEGLSRARMIRAGVRLLNSAMDRRLLEQRQLVASSEEGGLSADDVHCAILLAKNLLSPSLRTHLRFIEDQRWLMIAITESGFSSPKMPSDPDGANQEAVERLEQILDAIAHFAPGIRTEDASGLIFVRNDLLVLLAVIVRSISSTARFHWNSRTMIGELNASAMTSFEIDQCLDSLSDRPDIGDSLSTAFSGVPGGGQHLLLLLRSIPNRATYQSDSISGRSKTRPELVRGQAGLFDIDPFCRKILESEERKNKPAAKAAPSVGLNPGDLLPPLPLKNSPSPLPSLQPYPMRAPWPGGVAAYGAPTVPGIDWSSTPSTATLPSLQSVSAGSPPPDSEEK